MGREDTTRMRLARRYEARRAEDNLEILRDKARWLKIENEDMVTSIVIVSIETEIMKALEEDNCKEVFRGRISYMRRWMIEKLNTDQSDESEEEGVIDVSDQSVIGVSDLLRQKLPELEAQLYFLLTQLISGIDGSKEDVTSYDEFKSHLKWIEKFSESENKIFRAISDLLMAVERKFRNLGSSGQKAKKGGRIDESFNELLNNIQLVAYIQDQSDCADPDTTSLADLIQECEAQQKEIGSKIKADDGLKMRNPFQD